MALAYAVQGATKKAEMVSLGQTELSNAHRRRDGFFYRPSKRKTPVDQSAREVSFLSPFANGLRSIVVGEAKAIASRFCLSLIVILNRITSPSAIFGRVWTIIVNAVNAMFWRGTWTHIGVEVFKGMKPTLTYSNTAATQISVIFAVDVKASVFHSLPRIVFGGVGSSVFPGGFVGSFYSMFITPTSAACGIATLKIGNVDNNYVSAITKAFPVYGFSSAVRWAFGFFSDKQSSKALTSAVLKTMSMLTGCGILGHVISSFIAVTKPRIVTSNRSAFALGFTPVIISYSGAKG